ncbi:MAG: hypothetical protein Q7W44_02975 [Coriobacteriia bacterium]|nr:hypothetical protein [Coriobacteriia bacterium]
MRAIGITDITLVSVCGAVLLLALLGAAAAPTRPEPAGWKPVLVSEQATLWDLARQHPISDLTTAETVAMIRTHNDLTEPSLVIGQRVEVPSGSPSTALAARP